MEHHQQQQQQHQDDQQSIAVTPQYFYSSDQEGQPFLSYSSPIQQYQVVHDNPSSRHLSEMQQQQQGLQYQNMPMMYPNPVYNHSPPHVSLPLSHSPPPPSPETYDPLSPPISSSDTSADGIYNSSGANSPSSSRGNSLVHRHVRYNPTPSPTSSSGRRSRGRSHDSDEDDMGAQAFDNINLAHSRKEATRRQRIEAEQRRRDELRDGYAKLKDALPVSNQKSSKVSLLERATNYIQQLENTNRDLQARLQLLEQEMQRLRALNEKISLPSHDTPSPGHFDADARPLSPPPDVPMPPHSAVQSRPQHHSSHQSQGSSPSNSEGGY